MAVPWLFAVAVLIATAFDLWLGDRDGSGAILPAPPEFANPPPLPSVGLPGDLDPENELVAISAETARERNSARPFSTAPLVAAIPFRSLAEGDERERAVTCLAIAAIYEAGGHANDQMPVMQVILNRVRHPAWPNSVCGVVFQGSERRTGCQFSFTCDGSMLRWRPSAASLASARKRAEAMLAGRVEKRVGLATHYHTDWVLPYWSSSLDKITAVNTHLFFRWKGYWGSQAAFKGSPAALEPSIAQLASFSDTHGPEAGRETAIGELKAEALGQLAVADEGVATLGRVREVSIVTSFPVISVALDPQAQPGRWSIDAVAKCSGNPECRVVGWVNAANRLTRITPDTLAVSPPDFVYVQELRNRVRQAYWDCARWSKAPTSRCLTNGQHAVDLVYLRARS